MSRSLIFLLPIAAANFVYGQVGPMDTVFAGLSARTAQLAYQQHGGDMKSITPLLADAANSDRVRAYRSLTHATAVMSGRSWTPDAELSTGLDFTIQSKIVGTGEQLVTRATFLFDAPDAVQQPYKLQLDLLDGAGAKVDASVAPGILLGDVRGREMGETVGLVFDPSKLVQPGLHLLRATLKDSHGANIYEYYRSFFIVPDLNKRVDALEKILELLPSQTSSAALAARQTLETVRLAHQTYYGTGFQNLAGYIFTGIRAVGLGASESLDFDTALHRAAQLATALKDGRDPLATATGDIGLAYRSTFDGKLVPYRIYLPSNYDRAKKYPLLVLLHGAGGDETNFLDAYGKLWPKLAEQRGYILASVNGRGPLSGYRKETGGEQDVLDVLDLMKSNYSVDHARIYLGGHSMGGGGTWTIGLSHADLFAGLIPIAGSSAAVVPGLEAEIKAGRRLPVMMVCGVKDALVPVAGCRTVAEKAKTLDIPMKYAEYPEGDHLSVAVMSIPDIFNWLDAQGKASASAR